MEIKNILYTGLVALVLTGCGDSKEVSIARKKAEETLAKNPLVKKYDEKAMAKNMEELMNYVSRYDKGFAGHEYLVREKIKIRGFSDCEKKRFKFSFGINKKITGIIHTNGKLEVLDSTGIEVRYKNDSDGKKSTNALDYERVLELAPALIDAELEYYRQKVKQK